MRGRTETVKALLQHHADVTLPDKTGRTPLHLCVANGHVAVARLLLEAGADPTAKDQVCLLHIT